MSTLNTWTPFSKTLEANRGVGPGFDLLRIGLAIWILYQHTLWIASGSSNAAGAAQLAATGIQAIRHDTAYVDWRRPFLVALVPMFFALSGFLVMGSAIRVREIRQFLGLRALRIFPALAVEILLSAFVLGATLTTLSTANYFAAAEFWRYLANIIGFVSFTLPGVFKSNHVAGIVNANLWTLPAEFYCYLILAFAMIRGWVFDRNLFTGIYAVVTVVFLTLSYYTGFGSVPLVYGTEAVIYYFFTGALLFHWRSVFAFNKIAFAVACAASYALLLSRNTVFVAPILLSYATICIGMIKFPRIPYLQSGDYSYGVYLYGFPVAQSIKLLFPNLGRQPAFCITFIITMAVAVSSWHLVEKRVLRLKRYIQLPRNALSLYRAP